jgi:hypothetical protein
MWRRVCNMFQTFAAALEIGLFTIKQPNGLTELQSSHPNALVRARADRRDVL